MKKIFLLGMLVLGMGIFLPAFLFAQPINDDPCNAIALIIGDSAFSISNANATSPEAEEAIVPPTGSFDDFGSCVGGWCDLTGTGGGAGVDHSVWFKFVAPLNAAVFINLCASTFDSQVALYSVGDCADYSTFNYIYSSDDQNGCGNFPDADGDGLAETGLASTLRIECLNAGEEYYILVDAWQNPELDGFIEGEVIIEIEEQPEINIAGVSLSNPTILPPSCPDEAGGSIDLTLINGIAPIQYNWSNGASTQDISDAIPGTYTVTITDFCGTSISLSLEIPNPDSPEPITLVDTDDPFSLDNSFTQAFSCPRFGQVTLPVFSGTPPFTYQWSNGATSAVLDSLEDGIYTVTITDGCEITGDTLIQEFEVVTQKPDDIPNAGPDLGYTGPCLTDIIGFDNPYDGDQVLRITNNPNQAPEGGNIHCRFNDPDNDLPTDGSMSESTHWRAFDLSTFDIPVGAELQGVEVFVDCAANTLSGGSTPYEPGLAMSFTLQIASTTALDDENLNLIEIDTVTTYIPTTDGYQSYFIPFPNADEVEGSDVIVVSIQTRGTFGVGHFFNLASNETESPGAVTYLSGCGLEGIVAMENLFGPNDGFPDETIVNLIFTQPGEYTYQWDGDVDDPTSATPTALSSFDTYTVTITDPCGVETIDTVNVNCLIDNTEDLVEASFSIHPNPSNGAFQLFNEGPQKNRLAQVFDWSGKLMHQERIEIASGNTAQLQLSHLAKGNYLLKLSDGEGLETHRLVLQ